MLFSNHLVFPTAPIQPSRFRLIAPQIIHPTTGFPVLSVGLPVLFFNHLVFPTSPIQPSKFRLTDCTLDYPQNTVKQLFMGLSRSVHAVSAGLTFHAETPSLVSDYMVTLLFYISLQPYVTDLRFFEQSILLDQTIYMLEILNVSTIRLLI